MIDDIPKEPTGEVFIYGRIGQTYAAIKVSPDFEALKTFASMFRPIQGIGGERHEPVLFFILYKNMTEKDLVRHLKRQRTMETDEICVGVVSENLENIGNRLREYYLRFIERYYSEKSQSGPISIAEQQVMSNNLDLLLQDP
ncbi:hypothetical protein HYV81_05860 [Candidatus Woesearchaeota archaeon]|nr:hypothetical protein [Candidatus Woesearchaeota archaeon]